MAGLPVLGARAICVTGVMLCASLLMSTFSALAEDPSWTEPICLTDTIQVYFDSDISIGSNNAYIVSWAYDSGPVYLFRSADGGTTWSSKNVFGSGVFRGEPGMCTYSDGVNDVVLLATTGNVFKSEDNGDTFDELSTLALSDGALWWRFMEVYTNGSWFGRATDENIYIVGSQAFGIPWEGGKYVVSFCKSSDGGESWTAPVVICELDRNSNLPEMVCDGESLFVFYTSSYLDYTDLYVRRSDDWGATWSAQQMLVPHRGSGWVCPHSVQDLHNGRALLAMGDYVSPEDKSEGMASYGRYGYFHYSNQTFQEICNVSGEDWDVAGGFSAAINWHDELMLAWAKSEGHPLTSVWFTSTTDSGIEQKCKQPWIVSTPTFREEAGEQYSYIAQSLEADLGENQWTFRTNASWLLMSGSSEKSCELSGTSSSEGKYWVNLTVSDANSTDSINYTIVLSGDLEEPTEVGEFSNVLLPLTATIAILSALMFVRNRRRPPS